MTKTAETLVANKTMDDAIYFARIIREIYTGEKSHKQIPVEMYTNSKPLFESIYSTKQVDRKTVRHVIQGMKDSLAWRESIASTGLTQRRCWLTYSRNIQPIVI